VCAVLSRPGGSVLGGAGTHHVGGVHAFGYQPVYASTSVDWADAVDAAPTAMHAVGDGHEIALSPALSPLGTTGGD